MNNFKSYLGPEFEQRQDDWLGEGRVFFEELHDAVRKLRMVDRERLNLVQRHQHLQEEYLSKEEDHDEFEQIQVVEFPTNNTGPLETLSAQTQTLCSSLSGRAKPLMIEPKISSNSATPLCRSVS